jgi:hypothetical protein
LNGVKLIKRVYILIGAGMIACTAAIQHFMGRKLWGVNNEPGIWSGDTESAHNSQLMADPYSFSHVNHGLLFYGIFWLVSRKVNLPLPMRVLLAIFIEAAWEISENTNAVIERYRAQTISLHYYGDSIVNSMCDIISMLLGFLIATRLPWWGSIVMFFAIELVMGWWIRDGFLINVIMLLYPLEAIKAWQSAGQ